MITKVHEGVFANIQFALDLPLNAPSKSKRALNEKITANGGIVSYIVTSKSNFVVVGEEISESSFKQATARRLKIPIVNEKFLDACLDANEILNPQEFTTDVKKEDEKEDSSWLAKGKIEVANDEVIKNKRKLNVKSVKAWKYKDPNGPQFHDKPYKIVKAAIFKGRKKEMGINVLEVHVRIDKNNEYNEDPRTCLFVHSGYLGSIPGGVGTKQCRYFTSPDEAVNAFVQMWRTLENPPNSMERITETTSLPVNSKSGFGSDEFKLDDWLTSAPMVDSDVLQFVNSIWEDADQELSESLKVPWFNFTLEVVSEAQGILVILFRLVQKESTENEKMLIKLRKKYYSLIPHKVEWMSFSLTYIIDVYNLCQLIRDRLNLAEMSDNGNNDQLKYKALRCNIKYLAKENEDYQKIRKMIKKGHSEITIKNVYSVSRPIEDEEFSELGNNQLLLHATPAKHLVGIMSRGLLLPRLVLPEGGVEVELVFGDKHSLGPGLYFGNNINAVAEYTESITTRGTRFILFHQVALGNCYSMYKRNSNLTGPPEGYHSVHGVKTQKELPSEFNEDEYVIYQQRQQRIRYVVEFYLPGDNISQDPRPILQQSCKKLPSEVKNMDMDEEVNPQVMSEFQDLLHSKNSNRQVRVGLQSVDGSKVISLKSVAVRGRLLDLSAEVVILQEYINESPNKIEAKYFFPLDEMAAVCAFEAFLNGRHVVGQIKEKGEAHKEYKEAVKQGKSALLMDQETPDLFSVSVGNILPHSTVLVKIKYVTELDLEGDLVSFRLPGTISHNVRDEDTMTIGTSSSLRTSLELSLEMPYEIRNISSYTHRLRIKKTATHATIRLFDGEQLDSKGFQLLIALAEIHEPRMWTEEDEDHKTEACMLTFYPEFAASGNHRTDAQVVIVMDVSNSMKEELQTAQKVALLCIHHLTNDCSFNVVCFGSTRQELFADCTPHSLELIHEAQKFIGRQTASRGDSHLGKYLESQFLLPPGPGTVRNILLISDGHLNDDNRQLLNNVRSNAGIVRIFTLAIGQNANRHLMRSLAQAGAGCFEAFERNNTGLWVDKIERMMSKMSSPVVKDISVEWQAFNEGGSILQTPRNITTLFSGSRIVVYGILAGTNSLMATLNARLQDGGKVSTVVAPYAACASRGKTIHRLATRAVVRDWETGLLDIDRTEHEVAKCELEPRLVELSKMYSIVTPLTSFVAVDEENTELTVEVTMEDLESKESVDQLDYLEYDELVRSSEGAVAEYESDEDMGMGFVDDMKDLEDEMMVDGPLDSLQFQQQGSKGPRTKQCRRSVVKEAEPINFCIKSKLKKRSSRKSYVAYDSCDAFIDDGGHSSPERGGHSSSSASSNESHDGPVLESLVVGQDSRMLKRCGEPVLLGTGLLSSEDSSDDRSLDDSPPSAPCAPQTRFVGSSSGPQTGFGGSSSGPQTGFGGISSGPQTGFGGSFSGPQTGFGGNSSGPQTGFGGSSSGPETGFGGSSSGPQTGFGGSSSGPQTGFRGRSQGHQPIQFGVPQGFAFGSARVGLAAPPSFGSSPSAPPPAPLAFGGGFTGPFQPASTDPPRPVFSGVTAPVLPQGGANFCFQISPQQQLTCGNLFGSADVQQAAVTAEDNQLKSQEHCEMEFENVEMACRGSGNYHDSNFAPGELVIKGFQKPKGLKKCNKVAVDYEIAMSVEEKTLDCISGEFEKPITKKKKCKKGKILVEKPVGESSGKCQWICLDENRTNFGKGLPFCSSILSTFFEEIKHVKMDIPDEFMKPTNDSVIKQVKLVKEELTKESDGDVESLTFLTERLNDEGGFDDFPPPWNYQLWEKVHKKLVEKGLNSLTISSRNAVLDILSHLGIVFEMVKRIRPNCLPILVSDQDRMKEFVKEQAEELVAVLDDRESDQDEKSIELLNAVLVILSVVAYIAKMNEKFPGLYRTLELGSCWEEAFQILTDGKSLLLSM